MVSEIRQERTKGLNFPEWFIDFVHSKLNNPFFNLEKVFLLIIQIIVHNDMRRKEMKIYHRSYDRNHSDFIRHLILNIYIIHTILKNKLLCGRM